MESNLQFGYSLNWHMTEKCECFLLEFAISCQYFLIVLKHN